MSGALGELEVCKSQMSALEARLDVKEEAVLHLEGLNTRLRARLELFQRQNDENCKTAEAELERRAIEVASLQEELEFQRCECAAKAEALRVMTAARDAIQTTLDHREQELQALEGVLDSSGGGPLLAKLRHIARMNHMEVSSAALR